MYEWIAVYFWVRGWVGVFVFVTTLPNLQRIFSEFLRFETTKTGAGEGGGGNREMDTTQSQLIFSGWAFAEKFREPRSTSTQHKVVRNNEKDKNRNKSSHFSMQKQL